MAFSWLRRQPKDLVIPEDSRQVETPLVGSSEKVLSDLFPVSSITASFPVIGTTTYSGMSVGAPTISVKPDGDTLTDFDAYIIRKIEPVPNTRFVRCFFTRSIGVVEEAYKTETYFDEDIWLPPILYRVNFVEDRGNPIVTRGPGDKEIFSPRYMARAFYTDDQRGALVQLDYFVSDVPHSIGMCDPPRPISVQYDFYNVQDTFRPSLHPKLVFDRKQGAFIAYSVGSATTVSAGSSAAGQTFPATNHETWQTYIADDRQREVSLLYERVRKTIIPTFEPEVSKR